MNALTKAQAVNFSNYELVAAKDSQDTCKGCSFLGGACHHPKRMFGTDVVGCTKLHQIGGEIEYKVFIDKNAARPTHFLDVVPSSNSLFNSCDGCVVEDNGLRNCHRLMDTLGVDCHTSEIKFIIKPISELKTAEVSS